MPHMHQSPLTIGKMIEDVAARFDAAGLRFGHGTDNALDEAAWLVLAVAGCDVADASGRLGERLPDAIRETIDALARRRIVERRPLAYLLQSAWFAGREFYVDERVLIPRSPIAELIAERFGPWLTADPVRRAVDIGTGSGCIGIALALEFPDAVVDAVDISPAALEVCRINVERHGLAGRVRPVESSYFDALEGRYDLIVANPPYVDADDMTALPAEYRHEPAIGLSAGADGLDSVIPILHDACRFLGEDGLLVVEVGASQAALEARFPDVPFVWLDFEHGGDGVFLLAANDLRPHRDAFRRAANACGAPGCAEIPEKEVSESGG